MLWTLIFEFYIKYVFGGRIVGSGGGFETFRGVLGIFSYGDGSLPMDTSTLLVYNNNMATSTGYYLCLGNYLSLIATIITMIIILVVCFTIIKKCFNIFNRVF